MSESARFPRGVLFWAIALGGAAFDLATKKLVFDRIGPPPSRPVSIVPNVLELHTSFNAGALWGMGRNLPHSSLIFAGLSVLAVLAICYYLFIIVPLGKKDATADSKKKDATADSKLIVALGLIMAGAIGNCYDRLMLGHVRDFVHFHVDPIRFDCAIFNFADNMLVAGAVILMLLALRPEPGASSSEPVVS